jgi:hypothetical protein
MGKIAEHRSQIGTHPLAADQASSIAAVLSSAE